MPGEHRFFYGDNILDLSYEQKRLVWEDRQPHMAPFISEQDFGPLLMTAKLTDSTFLKYVNDGRGDEFYGALLLVKDGVPFELINKLPEEASQALFNSFLDASAARGDRPVVTYCSFD